MAASRSRLRATLVSLATVVTLTAGLSGCAVVPPYVDERCEAVYERSDGSWFVNRSLVVRRTIRIASGATLHVGEVIDGVDVGAVLKKKCRDPSLNVAPPVARF